MLRTAWLLSNPNATSRSEGEESASSPLTARLLRFHNGRGLGSVDGPGARNKSHPIDRGSSNPTGAAGRYVASSRRACFAAQQDRPYDGVVASVGAGRDRNSSLPHSP